MAVRESLGAFCPRCGAAWSPPAAGSILTCASCGEITYRNPAVGVAVVVVDGGRVLLGRRCRGRYAGSWCIPCGYVEWGEGVRDAARREFREETGLAVELGAIAAVHSNFHDPDKLTVGIWFHGSVSGDEPRAGDDLDEVGYFALDALPPLAFPTDAVVLADLRSRMT